MDQRVNLISKLNLKKIGIGYKLIKLDPKLSDLTMNKSKIT